MPFVSEPFTGSDGTFLDDLANGVDWVKHPESWPLSGGDFLIVSNRARKRVAGNVAYWYADHAPPSADYEVEAVIRRMSVTADGFPSVVGRSSVTAQTGYIARYNAGTGNFQLRRINAGSFTTLGGDHADAWDSGEDRTLTLRMDGADISVLLGGAVIIGPITDGSPITGAGRAALRITADTVSATEGFHVDTFEASELDGNGGPPPGPITGKRVRIFGMA